MTENKRFELEWRDTGEVLVDNETGRKHGIYSPTYRFHVRDMMNELAEENKELKSDNDIKFWKHQFMRNYNAFQIIMHEISRAIDEGYEVSNEFKQYLHDLKVQNEKNVEKAKRLGI